MTSWLAAIWSTQVVLDIFVTLGVVTYVLRRPK
jgi:hypothetical protein